MSPRKRDRIAIVALASAIEPGAFAAERQSVWDTLRGCDA
jgi:hypothetical protein